MSGLLSQYFCSTAHVSIVKTLDPVSQMGPCQVGCRVFMLPHLPILTMETLVGVCVMSGACPFLMRGVCFPNLVLREHCYGTITSLERRRNVLQGFSSGLFIKARQRRRRYEERQGGLVHGCGCAFLHLSLLVYPSRRHVDSVGLQ